jgi:hypothetical protein
MSVLYVCVLCNVLSGWVNLSVSYGRAMTQAVSRLPPTADARVRSRVSPCGICRGQLALGQVFTRVRRFSPVNLIPPVLHYLEKLKKNWSPFCSSSSQSCTISLGCGTSVASAAGPFSTSVSYDRTRAYVCEAVNIWKVVTKYFIIIFSSSVRLCRSTCISDKSSLFIEMHPL